MTLFVIAEIFVADGARRHKSVGARLAQFHEQTCAGDTGNPALEGRTDAIGEEMRDQAVVRLALGQHGAALGGGNLRADLRQGFLIGAVRQTVVAEFQCAYQSTMHDQVSVAADRRGEMRVAAQVQSEVAVVLGGIFGLRLRAQDNLIHELLGVASLHT